MKDAELQDRGEAKAKRLIFQERAQRLQSPYLVGIGASAGGREALEDFFDNVSEKSDMAYLVIQHLSPDFKSMTDELLARHTRLPIHPVEDGMRVEGGNVYLLPPKKEMVVSGGTLRLTDKDPQQRLSLPIDHFLESLAEECGERAIAVILSGTGSDGSRGIRAVHEAGGLVVVQSPETASFDGMPLSAQETGAVDIVLSPAEIPMALVEYAADPQAYLVRHQITAERPDGWDVVFDLSRLDVSVLCLDRGLRVRRVTPGVTELFRLREQDVGRPLSDFAMNIDYPSLDADLDRALHAGTPSERDVYDHRGRCFLARVLPYRTDRGIDGVVITFTDVTKLDEARRQLRESERRFRGTFENARVGIAHVDLNGQWLEVNERLCEILGYEREELLHTSFQMVTHQKDRDKDVQRFADLTSGKIDRYNIEKRLIRRDGSTVWGSLTSSLQCDDEGRPLYCIRVVQDISRRKASEEQLRAAVQQRDQFLAMLSHELRNPMAAVTSALDVLDRADAPAEARQTALQVLRRQTLQMRRLLDDLLDASRLTQKKIDFRPQRLDFREVVRETCAAHTSLCASRDQQLTVILADHPVWVNGDPARLNQIIENLLTNATKYTPTEGRIEVSLEEKENTCVLRVRDNGRGIRPEMLESIFDMFVQSGRNLDRSDGGMGVGLTLVRGLVELHGGTIQAISEGEGRGSEFVVELPLATESPPPETTQSGQSNGDVSMMSDRLRILIVEDNADSRTLLSTLLQMDGHEVTVAADGEVGLATILKEQPDVALVDIGLPVMTGYDVVRKVRELAPTIRTRLVAVTGYGQAQDVQKAVEAGFDEHLTKPIEMDAVNRLLSSRAPSG